MDKILNIFFAPFVPFIVFKTTVPISRFQRKNRFEKRATLGWDICKNLFLHGTPNQTASQKWFFSNISLQGGLFFQPFFALKPWDWDGHFEYNKRSKRSKKDVENFVHKPKILPQNPKFAEKLDLIGQNGYSFSYMWPLIEKNQVKYPKQHLLFSFCSPVYW